MMIKKVFSLFLVLFCYVSDAQNIAEFKPWKSSSVEEKDKTLLVRVGLPNGGTSIHLVTEPKASYHISFEARGDVTLQGMVTAPCYPKGRFDFIKATSLNTEWQFFSGNIKVDDNTKKVYLLWFAWKQAGYFELRNVKIRKKQSEGSFPALSTGKVSAPMKPADSVYDQGRAIGVVGIPNAPQPFGSATLSVTKDSIRINMNRNEENPGGINMRGYHGFPEGEYRVCFEARGSNTLKSLVLGEKQFTSIPIGTDIPLSAGWQKFEQKFRFPDCEDNFSVKLSANNKKNDFEIRNFTVTGSTEDSRILLMYERFLHPSFTNNQRDYTMPMGWHYVFYDGASAVRTGGLEPAAGKGLFPEGTLTVNVPDKGISGFETDWRKLPPGRNVIVTGQLRSASTLLHAEPVIRFFFADKTRKILAVYPIDIKLDAKGKWQNFRRKIPIAMIPEATAYYSVMLGARSTAASGTGSFSYDNLHVTVPPSLGNILKLRPTAFGGIFFRGEIIEIKATGTIPDGMTALTGDIFDSQGNLIHSVTVSSEKLKQGPWSWLPSAPGFYNIEFKGKFGEREIEAAVDYTEHSWFGNQIALFEQNELPVIVSSRPRGGKPASWLGFNLSSSKHWYYHGDSRLDYDLAVLLGGKLLRFHGTTWEDIEPQKGKFDFYLDSLVKKANADNIDILLNIYGTARWASSRADDSRSIQGWIPAWSAVIAKNSRDIADFWNTVALHYRGKIRKYEVWNEPHLPGFSIFWNDTPEHFVDMLRTASGAIRKADPSAEIWIGGMGQRYLPFYDQILKLGARKYFDVLPLHGRNYNADTFRALDRKNHSPEPVYTAGEWHSVLVETSPAKPNYSSSDREIAKVMLLDLLQQQRAKIREVVTFALRGKNRKENLLFLKEMGAGRPQSGGLFNTNPFLEPRFPVAVLLNLAMLFPEKLEYKAEYRNGKLKAAVFGSGNNGDILILWHDSNESIALPVFLSKAFPASATATDWEGKKHEIATLEIYPETFYFLPVTKLPPDWKAVKDALSIDRPRRPLHGPKGVLSQGELITAEGTFNTSAAKWNTDNWEIEKLTGKTFDKKSRFALAVTDGTVQLAVETTDLRHHQSETGSDMWKGDSIEFAFDALENGYADERVEFIAALTPQGPVLRKTFAAPVGGDLPMEYTPVQTNVSTNTGLLKIEDIFGGKRYLIRLKASELYPLVPSNVKPLRFGLIVNENNGKERLGFQSWGRGIGESKDPTKYGTLELN